MAASSGKYYADVKQGNTFHGVTAAAGTTFPLSSGTAMTFGLWNTATTKNAVLLGLNLGFTSGTLALGEVGLTIINAGFAISATQPITAFTNGVVNTTLFNAIPFGGNSSLMRFTPSAATIVAGVAGYWTGLSAITASTVSTINWNHDFDGKVILPPGVAAFVTGSIAQTALFSMCLTWSEVPV